MRNKKGKGWGSKIHKGYRSIACVSSWYMHHTDSPALHACADIQTQTKHTYLPILFHFTFFSLLLDKSTRFHDSLHQYTSSIPLYMARSYLLCCSVTDRPTTGWTDRTNVDVAEKYKLRSMLCGCLFLQFSALHDIPCNILPKFTVSPRNLQLPSSVYVKRESIIFSYIRKQRISAIS